MSVSDMAKQLPPLTWLRAFEASARHLSFTNAAAELNLTQAAISKQVKLLEYHLREPLFFRKPRSLILTRVGEAYLPKVRDAFERLAAGTEEVFGNRRSEVLTVRSAVGFSVNWIAPRLYKFLEAHPKTPVRLVSSVWGDSLDTDRFDMDIQYGSGKWSGFLSDRLTYETVTPVCAPALLNGPVPLATPSDLARHQLLHVIGYEEGWADWLKAAGASGVNAGQGLQFDTSLLVFEVAKSGVGVALGRSSMAAPELTAGALVAPFDLALPVKEAFYLLRPAEGPEHPDAAVFRDWLSAEAEADPVNQRNRPA
jgi:LysR family glycine cleavage system transcriptional activator